MPTTQSEIQEQLTADCQAFIDRVTPLSDDQFRKQEPGKWSVADVMQHLYLSSRSIPPLLTGPREVLAQWGLTDSPPRSQEEIAAVYKQVLAGGAKAPDRVVPRPDDTAVGKTELIDRFQGIYQAVAEAVGGWSEQELDRYRIPHPVLGKLTVREMLQFICVHTQHHLRLLPNW